MSADMKIPVTDTGPGREAFAVTPSDSVNYSNIARALYVGAGGTVVLVTTRAVSSSAYARAAATGERAHLCSSRHRGVARRGHGQRPVGGTELEALLERLALEERLIRAAFERGNALSMASHVEIDDVIDPASTPEVIRAMLEATANRPRAGRTMIDPW